MRNNLILNSDSYKWSHHQQYPPNTTGMFSYIEARGGDYPVTLFFGLQMALLEYLVHPITQADVDEAASIAALHGVPFNLKGWEYIVNVHDGYLPVRIKAAPEGSVVPVGNVLMTIESTDPKVFWVVSFLETMLLRAIWYPTTVATQSFGIKQIIKRYLDKTSDDPEGQLPFKLHDFGCRGVSSLESAAVGGLAHLVNFKGTDTVPALKAGMDFYGCSMAGFSIPAAEHSTITSWGRENEVEAYRNMLRQYAKPGSILAVVSDSYDIYHACEHLWGEALKQEVVESEATLVIRPDSGNPYFVVPDILEILADKFGTTTNSRGYKVLNHVRVIQGDGVTPQLIDDLLFRMDGMGFAADNIAFGMGGALLQKVDRDTCSFAMKCSAVQVGDEWVDVYKDPITMKSKASKKGRLSLHQKGHGRPEYVTMTQQEYQILSPDTKLHYPEVLNEVFVNGVITRIYSFDEVRANAEKALCDVR